MTMRDGDEVQNRIRQILDRELASRIAASTEALPVRCLHNHRQPLDTRKRVRGERNTQYNRVTERKVELNSVGDVEVRHLPVHQTIGLCMWGADDSAKWSGTICEEEIDAVRCCNGNATHGAQFTPLQTDVQISEAFHKQIQDLEWVAENLPEVSGLLWVLGGTGPTIPPPEPEAIVVPKAKWWQFWKLFE